jgi:hypothetical protein
VGDRDRRSLERRLAVDPGDQDALQAAIAARRRAGLPVPGWMLERRVLPGRSFDAPAPGAVKVTLPDGREQGVGKTPAGGAGLVLPDHRAWWVQPDSPTRRTLPEWVEVLAGEPEPGLSLRPDVRDGDLEPLGSLTHLRGLDLAGCSRLTAAGLAPLAALTELTQLNLWACSRLDDAGLALALAHKGSLLRLDLGGCGRLTEAGLAPLARSPELVTLGLRGVHVTSQGLSHLRGLSTLAALDLRHCTDLNDAGLEHVGRLRELTLLNLSFCAGLTASGLEHLRSLTNLSLLFLVSAGAASQAAQQVLAEALPQCQIVV